MDHDLLDLIIAWRGGDLDEARCATLLQRLRHDEPFRLAFVAEIRMLGMLKAVQSVEPRWLSLEDELGWSAEPRTTSTQLEDRVLQHIPIQPRIRTPRSWMWAAMAACLFIGVSSAIWFWGSKPISVQQRETPAFVAVVVKLDEAQWDCKPGEEPTEGSPLPGGQFRLRSGRVTLTMFNGVMLSLQGPADLDLTSTDRIFCQQGKLRARVPPGAEGFVVRAPRTAVVDLGTEFGLNVDGHGKTDLMVFEGKAEVSVLNDKGHTLRSELLEGRKAVSVDPDSGRIHEVEPTPDAFVPAPELISPVLVLRREYANAVQKSKPWGYWRFEEMTNGVIANEVTNRPSLRATGALKLTGSPNDNHGIAFGSTKAEQHLIMDDSWTPSRKTGYSVELWALPEGVQNGVLVNLIPRAEESSQKHIVIMELVGQGHHLVHDPCTVRFLDRWPPAHAGGVNVFSRRMYVPYRWHHLVAQKVKDRLELYVNGEFAGSTESDPGEKTTPCRLMIGRLKHGAQTRLDQIRPFVGRLDELAIYDHPLSAEDIRRHFELGIAGKELRE